VEEAMTAQSSKLVERVAFCLFVVQFAFGFFYMVWHQDAKHEVNIMYALPFLSSMGWFSLAMWRAGKP
jgi:hypothetical protein